MRSTPTSVSFWVTHSGRSPLAGAKATVISGAGRGWKTTGPSTVRARGRIRPPRPPGPDPAPTRHGAHDPAPSPAMTSSPDRSRRTSKR